MALLTHWRSLDLIRVATSAIDSFMSRPTRVSLTTRWNSSLVGEEASIATSSIAWGSPRPARKLPVMIDKLRELAKIKEKEISHDEWMEIVRSL